MPCIAISSNIKTHQHG